MDENKQFPLLEGMDERNADINQTLVDNQSQFSQNINKPIAIPDAVGPSQLQTPDINGGQNRKSFLDDAVNTFSEDSYIPNAQSGANIYGADLPKDAFSKRYDTYFPGLNNEDFYGNKQGFLEKLKNGTVKALGTTANVTVGSTAGVLFGLDKWMKSGNFSDFYKNEMTQYLDDWTKEWNDKYPHYQTDAEKEMGFVRGIFTQNFWTDKFLNNIGFIGGMALSGGAWGKALSGAGYMLGEMSPALGRIMSSGKMAEAANAAEEALLNLPAEQRLSSLANSYKNIAAKYTNRLNYLDKAQRVMIPTVSNLGIASSMSSQMSNDFKNKLVDEYRSKYNVDPTGKDLEDIDAATKNASSWMFGLSAVAGVLSFHGMFNKMLNPSVASSAIEKNMNNVIRDAEGNFIEKSSIADNILNATKVGRGINSARKIGGKVFSPMAGLGMVEFSALEPGVEGYYSKKYHTGDADFLADGFGEGLKTVFSKEGAESFLLGGLGGGIFEMSGKLKMEAEKKKNTVDAIAALNNVYKNSYLQESVKSLKAGKIISEEKEIADSNNDEELSKTLERQYIDNYLMPHIKWGMKNMVDSNLDIYRELARTEEGMNQLRADGIIDVDTNKDQFLAHVEKLQDIANTSEKEYKSFVMRYGRDPRFTDAVISQMLEASSMSDHYAERLKDLSTRINTVGIDLDPLFASIDKRDNRSYEAARREVYSKIDNLKIDNQEVKPEVKDRIKQYVDSSIGLFIERKKTIRQYEEIKNNPENYNIENQDIITSNVVNPTDQGGPQNEVISVRTKDAPEGENIELGVEYYAGTKITPGKFADKETKFRDFSKFTVLGSEPVLDTEGKVIGNKIRIRTEKGVEQLVPESVFAKYKLGRVADVEKSKKAKFFLESANDVYEFNFGKGRKRKGILEYSPKDSTLEFVYRDEEGNIHKMEVTSDQFVARDGYPEARIKKIGEIAELTEAEKAYFSSKEDAKRRADLTKKKVDVLEKIITDKKDKLKSVEDKILNHEIKLEQSSKNLSDIRRDIEAAKEGKGNQGDITPGKRTNAFKKALRSLFGISSEVGKIARDTEMDINDLYSQRDELQFEIASLEDAMANASELPDGKVLIDFLREGKSNLEDIILETGTNINTLSKLLDKERIALKRIIATTLDYIDTFESMYPDVPHSDDRALRSFIEKENAFSKDQNISSYFETNPDFFNDLKSLKDIVAQAEEIDIPIKEREIEAIEKDINDLYDTLNEVSKQIKLQNEVGNEFLAKLREWKKKQARIKLFETKEAKVGLSSVQKNLNSISSEDEGTNTPTEDYDKVKESWEDKKKDISNGLATSVDPEYHTSNITPFFTQHNYWSRRHSEFLNNLNTIQANESKSIVDPSTIKIVPITANNQASYGLEGFIPDSYLPVGETDSSKAIDNKTNAEKGAIALLYVHTDAEGNLWTLTKNGEKLNKFGGPQNLNAAVFTYLENADLSRTGIVNKGDNKFSNKENYDESQQKEILQKGIEARKNLLLNPNATPYEFSVSRGIPNERKYTEGENKGKTIVMNNPVTKSAIITENQIGTGVIFIPTRKLNGIKIEDNSSTGYITVNEQNVKMPLGRPVLKNGSDLVFLNNKKFSTKEANHLYSVIKAMADRMLTNFEKTSSFKVDPQFTEYLSGVLHFNDRVTGTEPKRNQIFFDGAGNLVMGKNKVAVTPDSIEANKLLITEFLENAFHNVNNYKLSKVGKEPFNEIVGIDKNGNPEYITWKSYEHYLLSDKYDLDKDRMESSLYEKYSNKERTEGNYVLPLTTNIIRTIDEEGKPITDENGNQEPPLIQKYVAIKDYADLKPTITKIPEVKEKAVEAEIVDDEPSVVASKKEAIIYDGKTENVIEVPEKGAIKFTVSKDAEGNNVIEIKNAFGKEVTEELKTQKAAAIDAFKKIVDENIKKEPVVENVEKVVPEVKTPVEVKTDNTTNSVVEANKEIQSDRDKKIAEAEAKFKNAPKNSFFEERRIVDGELESDYEVEDINELRDFLMKRLPQIGLNEVLNPIKTSKGSFAWGVYKNHFIQIYTDAPKGTGYHESFHAVWNSFLTDKEQQNLYNEFRNRKDEFTDRVSGTKLNPTNATNQQIREAIAEEFKEYKLTGKLPVKASVKEGFFKRLINFIKNFIFGKPETIEAVFKKIDSSYYRHHEVMSRENLDPEYSEMKGISEATKRDIIHGLGETIMRSLRIDDGALVRLGEGKLTVRDMFDPLFEKLQPYYEDQNVEGGLFYQYVTKDINKDQLNAALDSWEYIKTNRNAVVEDLISFFKKHKITFTKADKEIFDIDQQDRENLTSNEDNTVKVDYIDEKDQRSYDRDPLKLDAKQNSPIEIKILFDFLTKADYKGFNETLESPVEELSPLRLPQLVGTNEYFYKVLDELSGITGLDNMQAKLKELAKKEPVLVRLYKSLFEKNANTRNTNQVKLLLKFEKAFSKQKPEYVIQVIDEDGKSYTIDSNLSKDSNILVEDWESNIRGQVDNNSGLVSVDKNGYYTINVGKIKNIPKNKEGVVKFLQEIGLPVKDGIFDKLKNNTDREELIKRAGALYSQIESKELGIKNKLANKKSLGVETHLRKIAELITKAQGVSNPAQHINIDKESVQNYILPNYVSTTLNRINQAKSVDEFLAKVQGGKDVWRTNSRLLKKGGVLYDNNGKPKYNLVPVITEGLINNGDRISNSKMNKLVRHMQQFNMNLGSNGMGIFYNLIPADSKTEYGLRVQHYISTSDFKSNNFKTLTDNIAKDYLTTEINLIKEAVSGNRILTEQLIENDNYKKLRFFKDLLPKETVKKIVDYANDVNSEVSTEDFINSIKEEVSKGFWDTINTWVEGEKNYLIDNRIIQENGTFGDYDSKLKDYKPNYNFFGLNTDFTDELGYKSYDHNERKQFTDGEIDNILKFRLLNLMIHNVELHKVFFGDPAEYKDSSKRVKLFTSGTEFTHVDGGNPDGINKWANTNMNKVDDVNLQMGELGYHTFSDNFGALTFEHGDSKGTTIVSDEYEEIKNAIGEKAAEAYENVNEMDAQGIMLDTYWREYQLKSGAAWEADHELQHQYDMAIARKDKYGNDYPRIELKEADEKIIAKGNPSVKGMATPLKPKGAGVMENDSQMIPFSIKDSIIRLSYPLAKSRGLEKLYWFMHDNHIGLVGPKSHQKFGKLANLPSLYDKQTGEISLNNLSKDDITNAKFDIPFEYFAKIVETSAEHTTQTIGTQLRSLANLDSFDNGLPIDYFDRNDSTHDFDRKLAEWVSMSEDEKRAKSDRYRLYSDNNKALSAISDRGYNNTLDRLGITEKDGEFTFSDPKKIADFLLSEVTRRDLPDNIANAIQTKINDAGREELVFPLEALPNYNQLNQIIWSVVDKEIIRPKLHGGPKILVSATGFEKNKREGVYKKDGKWTKVEDYSSLTATEKESVRLTSSSLKFYTRKGEKGKTTVMQVYLPNIFADELKRKNSKITEDKLFDYLNTDEGRKLLRGIGFRIPTQGLNSVDAFEIAPWNAEGKQYFMPIEMGDSIIVPSEITAKVGSDFDIDKLNTYLKNFVINDKGYPEAVRFIEDTDKIGGLKDLYKQLYSEKDRSYALIDSIIEGKQMKSIPTLEEFIKNNKGKDPYSLNTKTAIENRYFETLEEILTLPENYARLVTPNSSQEMVDIEREISSIKAPEEKGRSKRDINYSNLLNPMWLTNERQTFLDAKALVGIAASNNTSHAVTQTNPIYVNDNVVLSSADKKYVNNTEIHLEHPKIEILGKMRTSLSNLTDSVGRFISDKISQYINGAVDAANDPWLMRMLSNPGLMSTAMFLDRIGVSARDTFFFINQPSIQDFIKQQDIQKAVAGINPDVDWLYTDDLLQTVKEKYPSSDYTYTKVNFTYKDMKEMMKKRASGIELSESENVLQKQILDEYIKYRIFSDHLFQVQNGTSWANMNKPNDIAITLKEMALDFSRKNNIIDNPDKMLENNFVGNIRNLSLKMKDALATVIKTKLPHVQEQLSEVIDTFGNYNLRMRFDDRKAVIEKANLAIIDYAIQNFVRINDADLNRYIVPLLISNENHLGKLLKEVQAESKGDLSKNIALNGLKAIYRIKANDIKNIQLQSRPTDAFSSNSLTESLRELRDNPITNRLYNNLVMLGLLQNGVRDSRTSFNKYIPYEDHEKYLKPAIDALESDFTNLNSFSENKAFFRNNWQDERIVPLVKKVTDFSQGFPLKVNPYFVDERLKNISQSQNNFLSLHELSNNAKYPVVKVTEIGIDPDTNLPYTKEKINRMKANGDNSFYQTKLFQRVEKYNDNLEKEPVVAKITSGGKRYLYKQINAWGDGVNFQEYYSDNRPSALERNMKVEEIPDSVIIDALGDKSVEGQEVNLPFGEGFKIDIQNKEDIIQQMINNKDIKTKNC